MSIYIFKQLLPRLTYSTQLVYDVRATLYGRWYDMKTLKRRHYTSFWRRVPDELQ